MRADGQSLPPLLAGLARWHVVLLHGADDDLIRTRTQEIIRHEVGSPDDPFAVSEHEADAPDSIRASLLSPAPSGRRVVRVRTVTDRLAPVVDWALQQPPSALLLLQAGTLPAKSRLRDLIERSQTGCAVACAVRGEGAARAIRAVLDEFGVAADQDAMSVLLRHAQGDGGAPGVISLKAALFAGPGGTLSRAEALHLAEGFGGVLEAGLSAGFAGRAGVLDDALTQALGEGLAGVAVLRRALRQVQALRSPSGFGRRSPQETGSRDRWSPARVDAAAAALQRAERFAKSTAYPADLICRAAVQGLAGPV
jgi:DNA polymerase-3 subunit delta